MKLALSIGGTPVLMPEDIKHLSNASEGIGMGFIQTGISLLIVVAIFTCLFFLMYGGFKILTSGGDSKKFEMAKVHLTYAVIGLSIVFLSFFIINVVTYVFKFDYPLDKLFK